MIFCRKNRSLGVSLIVLLVVIAILALLLPETDWIDSTPLVEDVLDDFCIPVQFHSKITKRGLLERWCVRTRVSVRWSSACETTPNRRSRCVCGHDGVAYRRVVREMSGPRKQNYSNNVLELLCWHLLALPSDSYQSFLPTSPKVIPTPCR